MLIIVLLTANCEVYEKDGNIIKTLLQYSYEETSPTKTRSKRHQNATSKEAPYLRTSSSTLKRITSKLKLGKTPSQIFDEVFDKLGGLLEVKTMSDVPTDRQQIGNFIEVVTVQRPVVQPN